MLRKIFNRAARPPYLPAKPVILVSTLGDDKTRGDSHGYIGIGKNVAEKLGGEYHYIDEEILAALYPKISDEDDALSAHLDRIGTPDIVFARKFRRWHNGKSINGKYKLPFIVNDVNEDLSSGRFALKGVVAHHITPEISRTEGQKFSAAYPDLPRPLVAVIMADLNFFGLAECLIPKLKSFPETSIFVCSSRRTGNRAYKDMINTLTSAIAESGAAGRIRLHGYNFKGGQENKSFNPYIGLLHQADHIVMCGSSQSILSEALSSGKSVHLYRSSQETGDLHKKNLVKVFNPLAAHQPLESHPIPPVNLTANVAENIISLYRHSLQKELGPLRRVAAYLMDG